MNRIRRVPAARPLKDECATPRRWSFRVRRLVVVTMGLGLVTLLPVALGADAPHSVEELLFTLEDEHGVALEECDGAADWLQLCGKFRGDPLALRHSLDTRLSGVIENVDWKDSDKKSRLRFELGGRKVDLTLQPKKSRLTVSFTPALPECGDDPRLEQVGEMKESPGFVAPARIPDVGEHPSFPERPRVEQRNGRVDALATIDTRGRVVDLCLVKVSDRGYGFEAAFFNALREWRYRPATLDGVPIDAPFTVFTTWTIH